MNQPTMVHQQPLPQRRQAMGVSIGALVFTTVEAAASTWSARPGNTAPAAPSAISRF